ncbi:hypothetical protein DM02DRAFT_624177 [Periconia macrospinosa]|uniref:Uncharacterized protein n=1 Tax=Periconia macrospinosa TaxID=97972 RepID=A0A2V1E4G2_9PLEO|nr:hypothetical protein DM02DRAFT_624177 [Periconia macrospinosa]
MDQRVDCKKIRSSSPRELTLYLKSTLKSSSEEGITNELFRLVECESVSPDPLFTVWLKLSSPTTERKCLQQQFSIYIRKSAVLHLGDNLRSPNWRQSWDDLGGVPGLIAFFSDFSENEIRHACRTIARIWQGEEIEEKKNRCRPTRNGKHWTSVSRANETIGDLFDTLDTAKGEPSFKNQHFEGIYKIPLAVVRMRMHRVTGLRDLCGFSCDQIYEAVWKDTLDLVISLEEKLAAPVFSQIHTSMTDERDPSALQFVDNRFKARNDLWKKLRPRAFANHIELPRPFPQSLPIQDLIAPLRFKVGSLEAHMPYLAFRVNLYYTSRYPKHWPIRDREPNIEELPVVPAVDDPLEIEECSPQLSISLTLGESLSQHADVPGEVVEHSDIMYYARIDRARKESAIREGFILTAFLALDEEEAIEDRRLSKPFPGNDPATIRFPTLFFWMGKRYKTPILVITRHRCLVTSSTAYLRLLHSPQFLKRISASHAQAFISNFAKAVTQEFDENDMVKVSVPYTTRYGGWYLHQAPPVKVSIVKSLSYRLGRAAFVFNEFSFAILSKILANASHIDIRRVLVSSILDRYASRSSNPGLDGNILDVLEMAIPLATNLHERDPINEAEWQTVDETLTPPQFLNSRLSENDFPLLFSLVMFIGGGLAGTTSEKYKVYLDRIIIPIMKKLEEHTFNIAPPKSINALNRRIRDDKKNLQTPAIPFWLSRYGRELDMAESAISQLKSLLNPAYTHPRGNIKLTQIQETCLELFTLMLNHDIESPYPVQKSTTHLFYQFLDPSTAPISASWGLIYGPIVDGITAHGEDLRTRNAQELTSSVSRVLPSTVELHMFKLRFAAQDSDQLPTDRARPPEKSEN